MKTIDEVVTGLTPAERERFKNLIEECRERERRIRENEQASLRGIKEITDRMIGNLFLDWPIRAKS